jgi:hypothetical protein
MVLKRGETVAISDNYGWFRFAISPMMDWTGRIEIIDEFPLRSNFFTRALKTPPAATQIPARRRVSR